MSSCITVMENTGVAMQATTPTRTVQTRRPHHNHPRPAVKHERRRPRLRIVDARPLQFGHLLDVRLQLLQATDRPRLANLWRIRRVHRRAVCGNVWLPADLLLVVGLAADPVPEPGP